MVYFAVVAKVAREVLDEASQVVFFRFPGCRYAMVGTTSLLVASTANPVPGTVAMSSMAARS